MVHDDPIDNESDERIGSPACLQSRYEVSHATKSPLLSRIGTAFAGKQFIEMTPTVTRSLFLFLTARCLKKKEWDV